MNMTPQEELKQKKTKTSVIYFFQRSAFLVPSALKWVGLGIVFSQEEKVNNVWRLSKEKKHLKRSKITHPGACSS